MSQTIQEIETVESYRIDGPNESQLESQFAHLKKHIDDEFRMISTKIFVTVLGTFTATIFFISCCTNLINSHFK